jgi:hypothetical protein
LKIKSGGILGMRSWFTKGRLITAAIGIVFMVAVFLLGARQGYNLGYTDGQNKANGWWIAQKSRYFDSGKIRKKRFALKYNRI